MPLRITTSLYTVHVNTCATVHVYMYNHDENRTCVEYKIAKYKLHQDNYAKIFMYC